MKTLFYSIALLFMSTFCFVGCNNNDDPVVEESASYNAIAERLSQGIVEIMQNANAQFDDGGYVVYDAKSDSMVTCSDFIYGLVTAIYDGIDKTTTNSTVAPDDILKTSSCNGWKFAGTCDGKLSALDLAWESSKKIPANTNFEVRVKAKGDGSYNVWYRVVS